MIETARRIWVSVIVTYCLFLGGFLLSEWMIALIALVPVYLSAAVWMNERAKGYRFIAWAFVTAAAGMMTIIMREIYGPKSTPFHVGAIAVPIVLFGLVLGDPTYLACSSGSLRLNIFVVAVR
jgi:hypothetical protein